MSKICVRLNPDTPPTGTDLSVVNAARRSFNTRSEWDTLSHSEMTHRLDKEILSDWTWVPSGNSGYYYKLKDKDKRLIKFLARGMTADDFESFVHQVPAPDFEEHAKELKEMLWQWRNTPTHESPFGHVFFSFEVKMPLFLARQLVKHKFLRWSEYSRRYITDDVEFYQHDYRQAALNKKQGSGGTHKNSPIWQTQVSAHNEYQLKLYNDMIADGVAPEQARGVLPADLMTAVTWSGSLDAFASMCRLRLGSDAQVEAQIVAQEVYKYLKQQCPVSAPALVEGVK